MSVSLLCYFEHLIFFLLCFQFFEQFLICLVSCLCHFSLSLLSCSFIGQLACIISDGMPCPFSFFLILQLLLNFLVPPPRFPSICLPVIFCQSSCPPSISLSITFILNLLFIFESFSFHHFILFTSFGAFLYFVQMIMALTTILWCFATFSPTTNFVSTISLILCLLTVI